jgi:hypothetical protein
MASQKISLWRYVFVRCLLISFVGMSASYFVLNTVIGQSPVGPPFYIFMKILPYWDAHPLQYFLPSASAMHFCHLCGLPFSVVLSRG